LGDAAGPEPVPPDAAPPEPVPADAAPADAAPGDAPRPDPTSACAEPRLVRITVNGAVEPLGMGQPFAHVRAGDTVTLSAAGSCVQTAPIAYRWQVQPNDLTLEGIGGGVSSRDLRVWSTTPGERYTVRLTITDGDGEATSREVLAFQVHGFAVQPPAPQKINDLAYGGGYLWIASDDGAFRWNPSTGQLDDLGATWAFTDSDAFTDNVGAVWYDDAAGVVWFAHKSSKPGVWRGDPRLQRFDLVRFDASTALGGSTEVYDIAPAHPGVRLATKRGVTTAPNGVTFAGVVAPDDTEVRALEGTAAGPWMGGKWLWRLAAPRIDHDAFDGRDNKITALALDDAGRLWVSSGGLGIAEVDSVTGEPRRIYRRENTPALPSDSVNALALDAGGDLWAATAAGVARYQRDLDAWVDLTSAPVVDLDALRAAAVDPATGDVYVGGEKGLASLRLW
jgi:hypothetical protein